MLRCLPMKFVSVNGEETRTTDGALIGMYVERIVWILHVSKSVMISSIVGIVSHESKREKDRKRRMREKREEGEKSGRERGEEKVFVYHNKNVTK